jgi:hypothetical protein
MWYILAAVAGLLLAMNIREGYVEYQDDGKGGQLSKRVESVTRPELNAVWKSKIEAEAQVGADESNYIPPLLAFFEIYQKSTNKPTLKEVDDFTKTPAASGPGVDPGALKKIIISGFHIDLEKAKEETKQEAIDKASADIQSGVLEPKDGRDEVFTREELEYTPADSRRGQLPEGLYEPTTQQRMPRATGEYDDHSTSWNSGQFYGVGDQTKNVL